MKLKSIVDKYAVYVKKSDTLYIYLKDRLIYLQKSSFSFSRQMGLVSSRLQFRETNQIFDMVKESEFLANYFLLNDKDSFLFTEKGCPCRSNYRGQESCVKLRKSFYRRGYMIEKFRCHTSRDNEIVLVMRKKYCSRQQKLQDNRVRENRSYLQTKLYSYNYKPNYIGERQRIGFVRVHR